MWAASPLSSGGRGEGGGWRAQEVAGSALVRQSLQ